MMKREKTPIFSGEQIGLLVLYAQGSPCHMGVVAVIKNISLGQCVGIYWQPNRHSPTCFMGI